MFNPLANSPWFFALLLFVLMALSIECGYRVGIRSDIADDENRKEQIVAIRDGLFLLLSLLLGFTLAMAVPRYDHRRELVTKEANAIGTTYLRAKTLAQPYQDNAEQLLRDYTDSRLAFFAAGFDPARIDEALARSTELQNKLWQNLTAVIQTDRSAVAVAFMNSLNEVIDVDNDRLTALQNRIPHTVWILISVVALIAVFTRGLTLKRRFWLTLVLAPLTIAVVIGLVADLDSSRGGLIRIDQGPLYRLKANLDADKAGAVTKN